VRLRRQHVRKSPPPLLTCESKRRGIRGVVGASLRLGWSSWPQSSERRFS
jgi:hypothetical protein